ncbi:MAG: hypothetical protein CL912_13020 [Deltaproteobacteria bacterium]|nr:hypothetical protein [Deltaproteobacteria bacterium]
MNKDSLEDKWLAFWISAFLIRPSALEFQVIVAMSIFAVNRLTIQFWSTNSKLDSPTLEIQFRD